MNAQIQTLKAEIDVDLQAIAEIYSLLDRLKDLPVDEDRQIVIAYYLHNLYCAFESIFQRIATTFENQISDQAGWHSELLRRMTLDIEGIRPPVLGPKSFEGLDELRRFRHLFRSAYRVHFDPDRLALVLKKARAVQKTYQEDISHFVAFLDELLAGS
jgi:hypothetical protein